MLKSEKPTGLVHILAYLNCSYLEKKSNGEDKKDIIFWQIVATATFCKSPSLKQKNPALWHFHPVL